MANRTKKLDRRVNGAALRIGLLAACLLLAPLVLSACDDSDATNDKTTTEGAVSTNAKSLTGVATANPMAGPAPLTSEFNYDARRSDGKVTLKWDFSDGTSSTEISPTHSFKKAEYYAVNVTAKDEAGHGDVHTLIMRAYKPSVWKAQRNPKAKRSNREVRSLITDGQVEYYTKYPEALPTDPKSEFYKSNPRLRPLLKLRAKAIKDKGIVENQTPPPSEKKSGGQ